MELSTLRIGDVDITAGSLKVTGKGSKERFAYFSKDAAACLERYLKGRRSGAAKDEPLFITSNGRPLKSRGMQAMQRRLGIKAGIEERLSPHRLRHSFATLSLLKIEHDSAVYITFDFSQISLLACSTG